MPVQHSILFFFFSCLHNDPCEKRENIQRERRDENCWKYVRPTIHSLSPPTRIINTYIKAKELFIWFDYLPAQTMSQEPTAIQQKMRKTRMGTAKFKSSWSAVSEKPRKTYNRRLCIRITEVPQPKPKPNNEIIFSHPTEQLFFHPFIVAGLLGI